MKIQILKFLPLIINYNDYGLEEVKIILNLFNADVIFLQESGYSGLGNSDFEEMKYSLHNRRISFF